MTTTHKFLITTLIAATLAPLTGCESNGSMGPRTTGATVGGLSGALAGSLIAGHHDRLLGALLGGAVGAGGGYLIGANWDAISGKKHDEAVAANQRAMQRPARPEDVARSNTADLNGDGFVTLDEVIAMRQAGLPDQEMLRRMQATGQVFELTPEQEQQLASAGVDNYVISQMRTINHGPQYQQYYQQYYAQPTPQPAYQQPYQPTYQPPPPQPQPYTLTPR